MGTVHDLRLDDVKQFSSFGTDIDLTASTNGGRECCYIYVDDAGSGSLTLELTAKDPATGLRKTPTLTVATGRELIVKARKILATTTNVTRVTVGWIG